MLLKPGFDWERELIFMLFKPGFGWGKRVDPDVVQT